jgi:hypothetical protein
MLNALLGYSRNGTNRSTKVVSLNPSRRHHAHIVVENGFGIALAQELSKHIE